MLAVLGTRLMEAYAHPRVSARRMLVAAPSPLEALLMAAAGVALLELLSRALQLGLDVTAIEVLAELGKLPDDQIAAKIAAGKSAFVLASSLLWRVAEAVLAAYLAWRLGGIAGGGASFRQLLGLAGWWTLASAPVLAGATLLLLLCAEGAAAFGLLALLAGWLYILYLFAAFVAEAHGFESEGSVFAALLGVAFGFAIIGALILHG